MQTFKLTLSDIYCPFPATLNPLAQPLEQHTANWVREFKLVNTDKLSQSRFNVSKFSRLVARACPTASFEGLALASDLMALLFLLDDHCDQAAIGKQPGNLKPVFNHLLEILNSLATTPATEPASPESSVLSSGQKAVIPADLMPFVNALSNIRQRLRHYPDSSSDWLQRFTKNLRDSIEANLWEAANRANRRIPDLATYTAKRALTNGFYWCQDLSELVEQINLPAQVREAPHVRQLAQTATNITGWFNDIVSLEKELRFNDIHNLVLILQHEYQLTDLQEALKQAINLHNQQVERFIELAAKLPYFAFASSFPKEANLEYNLRRYIAAMQIWIRSNVDWSLESGRYNGLLDLVAIESTSVNYSVD